MTVIGLQPTGSPLIIVADGKRSSGMNWAPEGGVYDVALLQK